MEDVVSIYPKLYVIEMAKMDVAAADERGTLFLVLRKKVVQTSLSIQLGAVRHH